MAPSADAPPGAITGYFRMGPEIISVFTLVVHRGGVADAVASEGKWLRPDRNNSSSV
jgi:hypothetical protein